MLMEEALEGGLEVLLIEGIDELDGVQESEAWDLLEWLDRGGVTTAEMDVLWPHQSQHL